jgi:ABC-type uncharacterized transport system permease subunit
MLVSMLHKHLTLSVILSAFLQIVGMLIWASLKLHCMSTIHSPFPSQLIVSNFSSLPIAFCWFFTLIALGDADLCLSLNASAGEKET